ncbi:MAG TPA: glycosyltransferase [Candidatus Dormibacteraeota bacterium]|nr:glycosyltransferase [Candidatus Dormibacteraeota bacterium]
MNARSRGALRSILLYAHDTYGLGHLRRNLAIADHLLRAHPGLQAVLMSGSPVAERFTLPAGLSLVHLPPVVKVGPERYRPRDQRLDLRLVRRARTAIMADVARRLRPDVFLVDHAPQGMRGELLPVFDALRQASPATRIVLGLRDVLDDPATVRRTWTADGVYRTLDEVFDRILVYGSAGLLDLGAAYGLPPRVAAKVSYCGYLARPAAAATRPNPATVVVGTAGGGGDGAEMLAATLTACRALSLPSLVVTGPLMAPADRRALEAQAATDPRARALEFVSDLAATITGASAVVTMGGYNTLCELVRSGVPTVVVPRVQPRREQAIRAQLFAGRGLVQVVEPGRDLAARLEPALSAALAAGRRATPADLDLDGLPRLAGILEEEAARSRLARQVPERTEPARPRVLVPA